VHEAQGARPVLLFENLCAGNIGRHEIGRELDSLEAQIQDLGDGLDQQGLGQTGHAGNQAVAAGEERHQHLIDDLVLAHDHLAQLVEDPRTPVLDAFGEVHRGGGHSVNA
jgi:hypothetical protein